MTPEIVNGGVFFHLERNVDYRADNQNVVPFDKIIIHIDSHFLVSHRLSSAQDAALSVNLQPFVPLVEPSLGPCYQRWSHTLLMQEKKSENNADEQTFEL